MSIVVVHALNGERKLFLIQKYINNLSILVNNRTARTSPGRILGSMSKTLVHLALQRLVVGMLLALVLQLVDSRP